MRKLSVAFSGLFLLLASCQKDAQPLNQNQQGQTLRNPLYTIEQINNFIKNEIELKGEFNWAAASDEMLWSAIMHSDDQIVSVGFKPAGEINIEKRLTKIDIHSANWVLAKQQVLNLIFQEERKTNKLLKIENLEAWKENYLPVTDVTIRQLSTLKMLRNSNLIRYVEPMGYDPVKYTGKETSGGGSGCGGYFGINNLIDNVDYTIAQPNTKVSWNYAFHGIQNAWTRTSGAGVKIMVIDSGVSDDQENLGTDFNQGYSTGRTIEKMVTLPRSTNTNDLCGHGTAMSGAASAPRGTDGNACGVAYNCNLVACHAGMDVFIDDSREVKGVSDAFVFAGNDPSIKITSMSMGRITTSSQIKDAILYAYDKGKLMFCAGGTSFSLTSFFYGVIFPATMDEVQAITGIKDYDDRIIVCDDCHKGRQIDFVIVMEKRFSGLHALSTAMQGDVPTIVGGSSVATATSAGIAALVWSKFPSYTREDVVNKLVTTSSEYPRKKTYTGWGKLNADLATQ